MIHVIKDSRFSPYPLSPSAESKAAVRGLINSAQCLSRPLDDFPHSDRREVSESLRIMGSCTEIPLYKQTAIDLLPQLRSGSITVTEYAQSLLGRIKARDEHTRAWAYLNPSQVLEAAAELDAIPVSQRGPLHGLAIGVKDVILTKDMPTGYYSPIYMDQPPVLVDAAPVISLRAAGALIFGKTATTEFASISKGGPARNPWSGTEGEERTPGGSSSGSAAAVADYQVTLALGTQTGGSTVRPGSYCGIYGFKVSISILSIGVTAGIDELDPS